MDEIQGELSQIITRTNQLQGQVTGQRAEVYKILETARIHERLLQTMKVASPVQNRQQVNVDDLLRREKLRLLAEQTQQTQKQLEVLERTRALQQTSQTRPIQAVRPAAASQSKTS